MTWKRRFKLRGGALRKRRKKLKLRRSNKRQTHIVEKYIKDISLKSE